MTTKVRQKWDERDVPAVSGKTVLITGANSGLGFETARVLAARGGHIIMACRNADKAHAAINRIQQAVPGAALEFQQLDLSSLDAIERACDEITQKHQHLDLLINNAGVMWMAPGRTIDGFETHFGTNHLGHFAFTARLLPLLQHRPGARIVTLSSIAHRMARIYFDDLWLEHGYGRQKAYGQSKLANLMFALELQRRLEAVGAEAISVAAHPGVAGTNLASPALEQIGLRRLAALASRIGPYVARKPIQGALPTLYAATMDDVRGGEYFGPGRFYEIFGYPARGRPTRYARDPDIAQRLWELSEELTGVKPGL